VEGIIAPTPRRVESFNMKRGEMKSLFPRALLTARSKVSIRKRVKGEDGFLPFLGFIALASPAVCTVGGVIYKVLTSPTALSTLDFVVTKLYHWFFK